MLDSSIIRRNESLKKHCTLQVGGPADYFAEPSSEDEIAGLISFAKNGQLPFVVIGRGSNILFDDKGYRGLIIKIGENFSSRRVEGNKIIVQSGAWMPCVARLAQLNGLAGLEHTVGIPGTVGGLVCMNGGSQRRSISEYLTKVISVDLSGNIVERKREECFFRYRHSVFQEVEEIIAVLEFDFSTRHEPKVIRQRMKKILFDRRTKFPLKEPNCGSVFKSNPDMYDLIGSPGEVLDALGFKGFRIGGAEVSLLHANFITNIGGASHKDISELAYTMQDAVIRASGFTLDPEARFISSGGEIQPLI